MVTLDLSIPSWVIGAAVLYILMAVGCKSAVDAYGWSWWNLLLLLWPALLVLAGIGTIAGASLDRITRAIRESQK